MNRFLAALKRVSSLFASVPTSEAPDAWMLVLARALVAFATALAGILVVSLVKGDAVVSGILGTLAFLGARFFLVNRQEDSGIGDVSRQLSAGRDASQAQIILFALTTLRPICIFLLLMRGNWLWIPAAVALSEAVALDVEHAKGFSLAWIAACAVALACGALLASFGRRYESLFVVSLIASAIAWMLPSACQRLNVRLSREGLLYSAELLLLFLGLLGQAM